MGHRIRHPRTTARPRRRSSSPPRTSCPMPSTSPPGDPLLQVTPTASPPTVTGGGQRVFIDDTSGDRWRRAADGGRRHRNAHRAAPARAPHRRQAGGHPQTPEVGAHRRRRGRHRRRDPGGARLGPVRHRRRAGRRRRVHRSGGARGSGRGSPGDARAAGPTPPKRSGRWSGSRGSRTRGSRRTSPIGPASRSASAEPVASYQAEDGSFRVIDPDGRVLDVLPAQPVDYLPITSSELPAMGPGEFAPAGFRAAASLVDALTPGMRAIAASVTVTPDASDSATAPHRRRRSAFRCRDRSRRQARAAADVARHRP